MTPEQLIAFEDDIAADFLAGKIKSPVHLAGGNEAELLNIFADINRDDWVLCSWRSHYHALLHGIPPEKVKAAIMAGRSIAMCFPEHKFISSAIVGGICPIAVGLAWAIKRRGGSERVHCFIGDMTFATGIATESSHYACGHDLPVRWYVENNGLSVCTDTVAAWGKTPKFTPEMWTPYAYKLTRPHVGVGKFVKF